MFGELLDLELSGFTGCGALWLRVEGLGLEFMPPGSNCPPPKPSRHPTPPLPAWEKVCLNWFGVLEEGRGGEMEGKELDGG